MNEDEEDERSYRNYLILNSILAIIVILVAPIFTVWSLQILFRPELKLTFETWCAGLWILTAFHGIFLIFKKN